MLLKNYSIVGVHWGASLQRDPSSLGRQVDQLVSMYGEGKIDPPLFENRTWPMADAANLLTKLSERGTVGKIVIAP